MSVDDLAEQDGAAVAKLRHKPSKLMTCIGHGEWIGAFGDRLTGQNVYPGRAGEDVSIQAKLCRQRPIEAKQPGSGDCRGGNASIEAIRHRSIGIVKFEGCTHSCKIRIAAKLTISAGPHGRHPTPANGRQSRTANGYKRIARRNVIADVV